jgi:hypothetical protein
LKKTVCVNPKNQRFSDNLDELADVETQRGEAAPRGAAATWKASAKMIGKVNAALRDPRDIPYRSAERLRHC